MATPIPGEATVVIFGATGDLTARLLMPALYRLHQLGMTPRLRVVGYAREAWDREAFRAHVEQALRRHAPGFSAKAWHAFAAQLDYLRGELLTSDVRRLDAHLARSALFFLALPPGLFGLAAQALGEAGLARAPRGGTRLLIVEKPFGTDLASAQALHAQMHQHWQEPQILRMDHFLGKETTQNLLVFRFANRFLDPVWNAQHIEQVQITYAETLGVEHRAGYYDHAGALRDMLQNHLMQLLCLSALEPLANWHPEVLRDHKVEVLRAVRPITGRKRARHAVRGQYTAAHGDGVALPGYRQEPGVRPDSGTETFAALRLEVANWRWDGVPFYLRSGKRLACDCSEIAVQFRRPPGTVLPGVLRVAPNWLVFRISPTQSMDLVANAKRPGLELASRQVTLCAPYAQGGERSFSAYEQLLMDALEGDRTHFLRFDEVEWAWRLLDPVLAGWRKGAPDPYPAGSQGPAAQDRVLVRGHRWRPIGPDAESA
jgi:glucose-6-phosphate 1-dehydrogenase